MKIVSDQESKIAISPANLRLSLLLLRIGVFVVLAMWTIDKIINPSHADAVFSNFYGLSGLSSDMFTIIGLTQALFVVAFAAGAFRTISYGLVLLMHTVSTLSSWRQYLDGFENLLFFAAWPMLAACLALFLMRKHDALLSVDEWRLGRSSRAGAR